MIELVEGCVDVKWFPLNPSATIYMGSLVSFDYSAMATSEGILVRGTATGANNTTNKDRPLGVAIGHNLRYPVYSSTYLAEYITDEGVTGLRTSTVDYVGVEGPHPKGGKQAMVQVAIIGPGTVLKAPIRNAAIGTNISVLTSTAGNANGLTVTTGAADYTPTTAGRSTIYCRTGLNAGQYRVCDDTSATVHAWDRQMLSSTATTGETYVKVPLRYGASHALFGDGTVCSFINGANDPETNYDIIHVLELNLETAGREFAKFVFDGDAFATTRA